MPEDPLEGSIQAEVNYIYQRHGRQPPYTPYQGPRPQGSRYPFTKVWGGGPHPGAPCLTGPRHSSTTVANQAYTFNRPTTNPHISYCPGNLSMSPMTLPTPYPTPYPAPYPAPYPTPYGQYPQPHQFNTFTNQGESNKATPGNTMDTILGPDCQTTGQQKSNQPPIT